MGLAKKLGIVVLLYVMLGIVWTFLKLSGFLTSIANNANDAIIYAIDYFFMPIQFLIVFTIAPFLPPPPVIF